MNLEKIKKLNIPTDPGCYQFYNRKGEIIYIGKAANLKSRVISYLPRLPTGQAGRQAGWQKSAEHSPAKAAMMKQIAKVKWIQTESEIEALLLESNLIKKYQPYFNVLMRDDKRFAYIKISLADEIPGVFITRKIDKSGKYFGPFISALAVRETLRAIRKIFPYCNQRKITAKPCFYYQLGRCLGVCGGLVSRQEYLKKVIKPLVLFLQGKKTKIVKELEKEIKKRESGLKKLAITNPAYSETAEKISNLKYQLSNFKQVLEYSKIISLADKYAADVVELAKLLNLPRVPERIEGYDISNIFGKEAVGSMVVFSGGEPDKSQYRKFKIRIGQGQANDVGMLREVLERRFKRVSPQDPLALWALPLSKGEKVRDVGAGLAPARKGDRQGRPYIKENWPLPDLIIIDGGKAQVNVASRALKKYGLEVPVIAISKGAGLRSSIAPDKLFFPGEKKPLELPLASPALHLLKRVRDEAHRFAIGYHRKLRSKNSLFKSEKMV